MPVMQDHELAIRGRGDEVIRQPLESRRQIKSQLIHSRELVETPDRARHIPLHRARQAPFRESLRAPDMSDELLSPDDDVPLGPERDRAIIQSRGGDCELRGRGEDQSRDEESRGGMMAGRHGARLDHSLVGKL